MADFMIAYKKTAINEGGYANDPVDNGGETWKGIARKFNPMWSGWKIVDMYKKRPNFPKNLYGDKDLQTAVETLYKKNYWNVIVGDYINAQSIANSIYDSAVNMGTVPAIKLAQRAMGLPETGKMDKMTLDKLNNQHGN